MDWIAQTISEFGTRIGLPGLQLDAHGRLKMALEDGSGLGLIHMADARAPEVIVYRSYPLTYLGPQAFRKALCLSDFRQPNPWPLQAGANYKELSLAVRVPERAFSSASLEQALEQINRIAELIR